MAQTRVAAPGEKADAVLDNDRRRAPRRGVPRHGKVIPWVFLAPYLILFGLFVIAPVVFGAWISLHRWDFTLPGKPFVGLENYMDLFDSGSTVFESFWTSPEYSHCTFTAMPSLSVDRSDPWVANLIAMDWENPQHRPILEMEGLRAWVPPRLDGYASLIAAVREQKLPDRW